MSQWKSPKDEMVAYRSFRPFIPLLETGGNFAVQLWAIWAIHQVCSKNRKRPNKLVLREEELPKPFSLFQPSGTARCCGRTAVGRSWIWRGRRTRTRGCRRWPGACSELCCATAFWGRRRRRPLRRRWRRPSARRPRRRRSSQPSQRNDEPRRNLWELLLSPST